MSIIKIVTCGLLITALLTIFGCGESSGNNTSTTADTAGGKNDSQAKALITIVPAENADTYVIEAHNMEGLAGMSITIHYATDSYATPVVTQGAFVADALVAANTTSPGIIIIAAVTTKNFYGSGTIAKIDFKRINADTITTPAITYELIDNTGTVLKKVSQDEPGASRSVFR